ncbi:hypothetical protein E2C01_054887 [Portunus trituberculatus]|uniref:Uncharacterized protein n=1 Tax=Portunus trituberculatus TaxID=210409 RepID=A0A5B7GT54_PORTR|nr:hypothetical protein [Portunus trituberculatus]
MTRLYLETLFVLYHVGFSREFMRVRFLRDTQLSYSSTSGLWLGTQFITYYRTPQERYFATTRPEGATTRDWLQKGTRTLQF